MSHIKILDRWKQYSKMSDLGEIARRKFFNNCFDGALTCAGIISGMFILFLANPNLLVPSNIIITGFATASAIGISGFWGAFLSEEAERKKKIGDLKKEMVILDEDNAEKENGPGEVEKKSHKKKKSQETIITKAEHFATIVASLVDGGAPVLGASLPLIPFFFGESLTIMHFITSYLILVGLLVYLGIFLGQISGGGRLRYALHLVAAGVVTLIVTLLLGQITG
jgi:predicted membrane protein (TIGR00267 family)